MTRWQSLPYASLLWSSKCQSNVPWAPHFLTGRKPWSHLTHTTCRYRQDTTDQLQGSGCPLRTWEPECPTVMAQWCSTEILQWSAWTEESIQPGEEMTTYCKSGVPIAGLQTNLIAMTLTYMPGPKATTADNLLQKVIRKKQQERCQCVTLRPWRKRSKSFLLQKWCKNNFYFPCTCCDTEDIRCLTEQLQYSKELVKLRGKVQKLSKRITSRDFKWYKKRKQGEVP